MGLNVFSGFTSNQTINVYGSTDEWLYTTVYDYNGVIINRTWYNNCDAIINYYYNGDSSELKNEKAESAPDISQIQLEIENLLKKENAFRFGVPYDDGNGMRYYYLRSMDNNFNVIDTSLYEDGLSAKVNCCYESDGTKYYGYYDAYYSTNGWYFEEESGPFSMTLTTIDFDYSLKVIGEFYTSYREEYTKLIIHKIENDMITYSLESNDSIIIDNFEQGEYLTAEFDSKIGEFLGFHYDIENEIWVFGAVEVEKVY